VSARWWLFVGVVALLAAGAFALGMSGPGDAAPGPVASRAGPPKARRHGKRGGDRRREAADEGSDAGATGGPLVHGTITVDPGLEAYARPGGSMHLRVVCLELRRPCMFQKIDNVQFPFHYRFDDRHAVSDTGLRSVRNGDFYVELFYAPPGEQLYGERENQIGGEAWGSPGKPAPLRAGAQADLEISAFWTPALYKGRLVHRPGAYLEGWIYPTPELKDQITPRNRLTFLMITERGAPGAKNGQPVVLAAKVFENIDPERPVGYHLGEEDFLVHPIDETWNVYYRAHLTCFGPDGKVAYYLDGGRASPQVLVGIRDAGFKIVLHRQRDSDGFASLPIDLGKLRVSETTYE